MVVLALPRRMDCVNITLGIDQCVKLVDVEIGKSNGVFAEGSKFAWFTIPYLPTLMPRLTRASKHSPFNLNLSRAKCEEEAKRPAMPDKVESVLASRRSTRTSNSNDSQSGR